MIFFSFGNGGPGGWLYYPDRAWRLLPAAGRLSDRIMYRGGLYQGVELIGNLPPVKRKNPQVTLRQRGGVGAVA